MLHIHITTKYQKKSEKDRTYIYIYSSMYNMNNNKTQVLCSLRGYFILQSQRTPIFKKKRERELLSLLLFKMI